MSDFYSGVINENGGAPALLAANIAARPPAGEIGRFFYAIDEKKMYRDNGTTWDLWFGGASGGTVSSFSAGTLSPLFTTSVATATTTPALSFIQSAAAGHTIYSNANDLSDLPAFYTPTQLQLYQNTLNAFGVNSKIGTSDAFTLAIYCNNIKALEFGTSGSASFSHTVTFADTATFTANILAINNVVTSWPALQGAANTFLKNDGSGNFSWVTLSSVLNAFVQNGNSFAALALLGPIDNFAMAFQTNNTERARFFNSGGFKIGGTTNNGYIFEAQGSCYLNGQVSLGNNSSVIPVTLNTQMRFASISTAAPPSGPFGVPDYEFLRWNGTATVISLAGNTSRITAIVLGTNVANNYISIGGSTSGSTNMILSTDSGYATSDIIFQPKGSEAFRAISGGLQFPLGNKMVIPSGSNARQGTATLVAGTATIATTAVNANSLIYVGIVNARPGGSGNVAVPAAESISAGVNFVINAYTNAGTVDVLCASVVCWLIIDKA